MATRRIAPLQHNLQTLDTVRWTRLAFEVTCQAEGSTDATGEARGDDGPAGDTDQGVLP
jgi:hypothetical protein